MSRSSVCSWRDEIRPFNITKSCRERDLITIILKKGVSIYHGCVPRKHSHLKFIISSIDFPETLSLPHWSHEGSRSGLGGHCKDEERAMTETTIKTTSQRFCTQGRTVYDIIGFILIMVWMVLLTTKHQVDKSHLHPPCQLRGRGATLQLQLLKSPIFASSRNNRFSLL